MKNNLELLNKEIYNLSLIEFKEKIIEIKRVTKVTAGGKKLSFRVITLLGDCNGKIGYGVGRGDDVNTAVTKSLFDAKKKLISVPLTINNSLPFLIKLKYNSCIINLIPTIYNTGIIANNSIKSIFELSGIKNIFVKQLGSNNILNNIKLIFLAL